MFYEDFRTALLDAVASWVLTHEGRDKYLETHYGAPPNYVEHISLIYADACLSDPVEHTAAVAMLLNAMHATGDMIMRYGEIPANVLSHVRKYGLGTLEGFPLT